MEKLRAMTAGAQLNKSNKKTEALDLPQTFYLCFLCRPQGTWRKG
jgi:hypothetical protein